MASKGVTIEGADRLQKKINRLAKREATKANRQAVSKVMTPVLRAVKDEVPVEEGDFKKAQARKVTNRGPVANGIVGTDRNYIIQDGERITKDEKVEGGVRKIPTNYDHLVLLGHVAPDGTAVPANPYLERAAQESLPGAQETYKRLLKENIDKTLGGR